MLCRGVTKEETEDYLIDLSYLGIENVFAIQGDYRSYSKPIDHSCMSINSFTSDLVAQITNMNNGKYLDDDTPNPEPTDFCIGVAGYPEKHYEAPNLISDIKFTKEKVDAGADYIVTQMFFDNSNFFNYVRNCRQSKIKVPIIPGLKVITSKSQLTTLPKQFFIDIPYELTERILNAKGNDVISVGIEWTINQIEELFAKGVPGIHIYITNNICATQKLLEELQCKFPALLNGKTSHSLKNDRKAIFSAR